MNELTSALESANLGGSEIENDIEEPRLKIAEEQQGWLNRLNEWCSEWCSSILVKETRQALKSRQFIWTYFVLLLCVGVWTVLGLTYGGDLTYRGSDYGTGRDLLIGYWVILGFPLALIIPFGAYRSLATEFEDGTIQLISITTMKPHQIVIGKFGSAILQMLIFLSVLAPCIAFTYLLRGISLEQILLGLGICVGGSICLTILGLFLAGAIRTRALGIGVSVLFVLLLGWIYYIWCEVSSELTNFGGVANWNEPGVIPFAFGMVAFFGSTAALLLVTAASQISFPSDNRSTAIRIMVVVQQSLFFAFVITMLPLSFLFRDELCLMLTLFVGHYWLIIGFLLIGESSHLSRRVQRSLPRTIFSRSFFSLLMPGSGRGYLFAVANVWICAVFMLLVCYFDEFLVSKEAMALIEAQWGGGPGMLAARGNMTWQIVFSTGLGSLFVTWFLSLTYLVMRFVFEKRKRDWSTGAGPLVSLLVGVLLVALISIGTAVMHYNLTSYGSRNDTTPWLVANWYWATVDTSQRGTYLEQWPLFILFLLQVLFVTAIAFVVASRELLQRPIAMPQRVAIEIQESRTKGTAIAKGESIAEIFGDLNSDERPVD